VTEDERERIVKQDWAKDTAMAGIEVVVWDPKTKGWRLNHRGDGACVLLDENNRCRIHAKFGEPAKPMACRIYPFVLVPAGDHWRVGLRFSCPSVGRNSGKRVSEQWRDLAEYAGLMETDAATPPRDLPPPELQTRQQVPWVELYRFNEAIVRLLQRPGLALERKLRVIHALAETCRKARFESVTGKRLEEFLEVVSAALLEEVPADAYAVGKPGWVGRMVFRQIAALYCRKDLGLNKGAVAGRGRIALAKAAWRFARGTGLVPQLHGLMPTAATFRQAEEPVGTWPEECETLLTRFYQIKVDSMQFAGPTNFKLEYWLGLDSLLFTYPIILWLARVIAQDRPHAEALATALRLVDDNFGFNPLYGPARQRWTLGMLNTKQELPKLIAWYSR
jgi:lysine-N-methylase